MRSSQGLLSSDAHPNPVRVKANGCRAWTALGHVSSSVGSVGSSVRGILMGFGSRLQVALLAGSVGEGPGC